MNATISPDEFHQWRAFLTYKAALQEAANNEAAAKARMSRGR